MINQLSQKIAYWLFKNNAISENEIQLYEYAVFCFLISVVPLFLSISIGFFMQIPMESVLFITPFIFLRKFCGGYHAHSLKTCLFISLGLLIVFLIILKYMLFHPFPVLCAIMMLVSNAILLTFSPIDSKSRHLSNQQCCIFHRICAVVLLCFNLLFWFFLFQKKFTIAFPICFGTLLTAVLQIPIIIRQLGW